MVDSVVARLHQTTSPYAVVALDTAMLSTNGQAVFQFPSSVLGNSYYISVLYRNAIETWSKTPVLMNLITNFSFQGPPTSPQAPAPANEPSQKQ
jgi:hypothetical protein